jgi:hypothetical protein
MMRHKRMALALVLALGVLSPASALATTGGTERPVKGGGSGTIAFDPEASTFEGDPSGVASHLGNYAMHFEGTAAPTGENTAVGTGTLTIETADGDQVTGTFTSTSEFTSSGATHTVVVEIISGTGRFAGASGTLTIICVAGPSVQVGDQLVSEIECTIKGRIGY